MQKKSVLLLSFLAILTLGVVGTLRSQDAPADSAHARHSVAVSLLRAINTAEYDYKNKHGAFASKDSLLASEEFKGRGMAWAARNEPQLASAHPSNGPEVLPGWTLRLNLTPDGKGYDVLLEDTADKSCAWAAYTDERGIIRESKPIGCKS